MRNDQPKVDEHAQALREELENRTAVDFMKACAAQRAEEEREEELRRRRERAMAVEEPSQIRGRKAGVFVIDDHDIAAPSSYGLSPAVGAITGGAAAAANMQAAPWVHHVQRLNKYVADNWSSETECLPRAWYEEEREDDESALRLVFAAWRMAASIPATMIDDLIAPRLDVWRAGAIGCLVDEAIDHLAPHRGGRFFWRSRPDVLIDYSAIDDTHMVQLRFRCQVEDGSFKGNSPEGARCQFLGLQIQDGVISRAYRQDEPKASEATSFAEFEKILARQVAEAFNTESLNKAKPNG